METKILVADDERAIADIVKFNLAKEGYSVEAVYDGQECIDRIKTSVPDLLILDIMMPKKDGFEVLKEIRTKFKFPVIMLTAKEDESDKIMGLELGADDYIVKPFSMKELIARVKANLRRIELSSQDYIVDTIEHAGLEIDLNKYEVKKDGEIVELTLREFELLKYLAYLTFLMSQI